MNGVSHGERGDAHSREDLERGILQNASRRPSLELMGRLCRDSAILLANMSVRTEKTAVRASEVWGIRSAGRRRLSEI